LTRAQLGLFCGHRALQRFIAALQFHHSIAQRLQPLFAIVCHCGPTAAAGRARATPASARSSPDFKAELLGLLGSVCIFPARDGVRCAAHRATSLIPVWGASVSFRP
jgi:hypothetical protein